MSNKITQIFVRAIFILLISQAPVLAKEVVKTPYEHMPVDAFVAGFPLATIILLGFVAYTLGVIYVLHAVLLKNRK
jgi:hypothetical protein